MKQQYISANVYRWNLGDCTNGGITAKASSVLVPCKDGNHRAEDSEALEYPLVEIEFFHGRNVAYPVNRGGKWFMFGGNFIWSSDSRFRQQYGDQPLPVFDRTE